ncbi:MAG: alpha/beta hydrolase [Candidatus Wallbacteria bacterium]
MNGFKKRMIIYLLIVAGVYLICGIYLMLNINQKIFHPRSDYKAMPEGASEFFFETLEQEKLCGWFIPYKGTSECVLLYNHGNTGNLSDFIDDYIRFSRLLKADIYTYDYKGYGKSTGTSDYKTFYADCDAALDYVTSKIYGTNKKLVVYGRSLGGAAAIGQADSPKVDAIITESTFASLKDHVLLSKLIFIFYPFVPNELKSKDYAERIEVPWFMAHAELDMVINNANLDILNRHARCDHQAYIIKNVGHNRTGDDKSVEEYFKAIELFINSKLRKEKR